MTDYISREAAKEVCAVIALTSTVREMTCGEVKRMVESIPAADVREVVRGVWCPQPSDLENCTMFVCSNCGHMILISNDREELPYCGNCGADMREEQT